MRPWRSSFATPLIGIAPTTIAKSPHGSSAKSEKPLLPNGLYRTPPGHVPAQRAFPASPSTPLAPPELVAAPPELEEAPAEPASLELDDAPPEPEDASFEFDDPPPVLELAPPELDEAPPAPVDAPPLDDDPSAPASSFADALAPAPPSGAPELTVTLQPTRASPPSARTGYARRAKPRTSNLVNRKPDLSFVAIDLESISFPPGVNEHVARIE
jgi:hypothetical protein